MQIKTKRVSHALCFISLLLYPALANAQSGTAAPEGQPREESTLGAGPASPESPAPAPALRPLAAPVLMPASPIPAALPSPPSVTSKFSATLYGFVEFDSILDSTQSFNDLAGNGTIVHGDSYAAKHDRVTFGARNSRLGFKLKGPESETIKSSAIAEMDFLGNQPQGSPSPAGSPAVSASSDLQLPLGFQVEGARKRDHQILGHRRDGLLGQPTAGFAQPGGFTGGVGIVLLHQPDLPHPPHGAPARDALRGHPGRR